MKTALSLLAVATVLFAPNVFARQSSTDPESAVVPAGIQESDGEFSPQVQLHIARGDELSTHLRFAAAAREYRKAADVARSEGHLASGTTWKLANAYYYDGNLVDAAAALDRLADEAAQVGDLAVEGLAIYHSAWLNGKAGRKTETTARVARLEALLRSRYMPVAIRERLSSWLKTSRDLAAVSAGGN
ncbi:MAG TPA: hypothetical protein VG454_02060 [Gemmatimonadales bacterium]|nr:hypothetical protein [Gemmatimonadales bacterium]